jgi:hypothetical protein
MREADEPGVPLPSHLVPVEAVEVQVRLVAFREHRPVEADRPAPAAWPPVGARANSAMSSSPIAPRTAVIEDLL